MNCSISLQTLAEFNATGGGNEAQAHPSYLKGLLHDPDSPVRSWLDHVSPEVDLMITITVKLEPRR